MSGDFCYSCDGTGEHDPISGAKCYTCNGTGWCEDEDPDDEFDDDDSFWDEREQP